MSRFVWGRMRSAVFWLPLWCLLGVSQAQAEVLKLSDGTVWGTSFSRDVNMASIVGKVTPQGKQQLWFTLDRERNVKNNFRTELSGRMAGVTKAMEYGRQYGVDFTLLLPDDWKSDNSHEIVFQLHRTFDEDEKGHSGQSVFAIRVINNSIYSTYCYSTAKQSWGKHNMQCVESGQLAYASAGNAYRFHLDLKLSRGHLGTGAIRIAVDDVPKFSYDGPFGYDDDIGPYVKFGIYKSPWRPEYSKTASTTTARRYGFEGVKVEAAPAPAPAPASIPAPSTMLPAAETSSVVDALSANAAVPAAAVAATAMAPVAKTTLAAEAIPAAKTQSNSAATRSTETGAKAQMNRWLRQWMKLTKK